MASGKAIGATLVLGGGGATAGAAMGGAFSSSKEQTQDKEKDLTPATQTQDTTIPTPEVFTNTTGYENKLLTLIKQDNLQYIVKPVSTGEKQAPTQKWWDWALTHKFNANKGNETLEEPFNVVNTGYGTTPNALNQACDTAYKKQKGDYESVFTGTSKLLENIKKFCTLTVEGHDVSEPKSTSYSAEKLATDNDYGLGVLTNAELAKKLVDATTTKTDNDLWFKWAFEKRAKDTKAKASSTFSSVSDGTALKTACDAAYKKNRHELTDVEATDKSTVLKDIGKYCASTPVDNLTAPNTVPASEPTANLELFQATDTFSETVNKDYKDGIIKYLKTDNLAKIVKHDHKNNRTWWDWAFSTKYDAQEKRTANNGKLDDLFKHITTGYSAKPTKDGTNETALNQACNKAYMKGKGEYKFGDADYLLKNIGQFCTKAAEAEQDIWEPKSTLLASEQDISSYTNGIFGSGKDKNKNKLVKPNDQDNQLWWDWAYERIWKKQSERSEHFKDDKKVTKGYGTTSETTALNQVCDCAYKKPDSQLKSATTPKLYEDIKKFCSPSNITSLDTLP